MRDIAGRNTQHRQRQKKDFFVQDQKKMPEYFIGRSRRTMASLSSVFRYQ